MAKPTSSNVSIKLDQYADGPVLQGDVPGTGQTQEVFVNGNLNAQKAHYNEGDAIPYRAVLDNLTPNVTYALVIQWDTVDSGAYALDYLTGYNFSFEGTKHVGEPDVNPLLGVTGISSGATTLAAILADPQLMLGFGSQFGVTDGIDAGNGLPSGAQSITLFGAVSNATVSVTSYNADKTKASVTITFTYTGTADDNADAVVVAWGGHIASSLDWHDDAGETVQTASDISGSPYHMRVLSLIVDGTTTSVGNQDRSLSADAVLPPIPPDAGDVSFIVDDDDTPGGIGDAADGDDVASVPGTDPLPTTDATSVDFADLHLDPVLNTSSAAVKSGGVALFYFWDGANSKLYASTDVTNVTTAGATAVFSITLQEGAPGVFDYFVALLDQIDHPAGSTENNVLIDVTYTATGLGGSTTGVIGLSLDDDIPVRASSPTAVTATVEEDGMSSAVTPEAGGLNGNDQSLGIPGAGDTLGDDQASGAAGSLTALVDVGADQPGKMTLSSVTTSLPTLFSKGDAVTYAVTDSDLDTLMDTLTATAGGRTVFTLKVNPDGSWAFDLDDQLDHVDDGLNTENTALRTNVLGTTETASIDFSLMVQVTDFDGDTVAPLLAGDFAITVEDDIPVFNSITNVVAFNTGDPMTGKDSAGIGADDPGDIVLLTLSGTAPSGRTIFNVSLNQDSPTVTSFSFDYFTKVAPSTDTVTATGTVTFNADGTYVIDLDGPIVGGTTFSTSGGTSLNYDTIGNNSPEITVKQYTSDFFGVLTGQSAVPPSDTADLLTQDGDHSFAAGDTFKSTATSYVNVATDTVGVDSDTIQAGELLNYDFYTSNPVSPASPAGPPAVSTPTAVIVASTAKAFVDTVDITLNQVNVGKEDIAILLKLYNADTNTFDTKLLLANSASDYQAIAGSTDVKVSITEDDYQDGFRIYGMQILTSTENLTGTGFSLSTGGAVSLGATGAPLVNTSDADVVKIIRIEVTANLPGDSDLAFTGKLVDEDGDESSGFGFSVHLEGDSQALTGAAGADVFQFGSGDSGITLATADTILGFATGVDKISTSGAAGDATIADGGGLADFAAFVTAANGVLAPGAGTNDVYAAYNAAGSGNAWAVVDENDTGSVDAGDTLIVLAGINTAPEILPTDFI
jgi:T1SS-143 domain-containing protein